MNASNHHADPSPAPVTTREGHHGSHTRRAEAGADRHAAIARHLDAARACFDKVIASCLRHEARGDLNETDDRGRITPRHLTEIDSLRRLRGHLDRLAARFLHTAPRAKPYGEDDPLLVIEFALMGCAGALVERFEGPDHHHDLLADLEADLCTFERLLDERAGVNFAGGAGG